MLTPRVDELVCLREGDGMRAAPTMSSERRSDPLYAPLDVVLVRAPLLPIEAYLSLTRSTQNCATVEAAPGSWPTSLLVGNEHIRDALGVASPSLSNALDRLERSALPDRDARRLESRLLRYLIRMATRPTPFGLFAGTGLGRWGATTNLALNASSYIRTRPDMEWLLRLVFDLEARPEVRQHLCFVANGAAFSHSGRIFLTERASCGDGTEPQSVSLRATGVVQRALSLAHDPIRYSELFNRLVASTPGARADQVESLIDELWRHTLLLSDLRPPLTIDDPAGYVAERLRNIPAAHDAVEQLKAAIDAAGAFDARQRTGCVATKGQTSTEPHTSMGIPATPVQVDSALVLAGNAISAEVGREVARAAELLLRLSTLPRGLPYLIEYRRAFVSRYGPAREVPLLELLDPSTGLGNPFEYGNRTSTDVAGIAPVKSSMRHRVLLDLAYGALNDRVSVVELDSDTLSRLETCSRSDIGAPLSLDICAYVAATSAEAIDSGEFQVIIGPNLGAMAAGRTLGRFGDLLAPESYEALQCIARAEEGQAPDHLYAELVYLPYRGHSANVAIRPNVRTHEIVLGVSPSVPSSRVIPINELLVGVRNDQFYLRWSQSEMPVSVCAGHMLNPTRAPIVCRFLSDVGRDGMTQLSSFDWGPAFSFPLLPRVQVGRIVLCLAQWRIDSLTRTTELSADDAPGFLSATQRWRTRWRVPRYVYLTTGDNRLVLDLEDARQVEELRTEVQTIQDGRALVLQEMLPQLEQNWVRGPGGHFITEYVVSLVRNRSIPMRHAAGQMAITPASPSAPTSNPPSVSLNTRGRLRPPGTEWLFVKLYGAPAAEDDFIAGPVRAFVGDVIRSGIAGEWFFLRYSDPDRHVRLRFRGAPDILIRELFPQICHWARELMSEGLCSHFTFDTYDRELERYGGHEGAEIAEQIWAADSRAVADILSLIQTRAIALDRITLGALSIDDLLAGLQLGPQARLDWYQEHVSSRQLVGEEYRERKAALRSLLGSECDAAADPRTEVVAHILAERRDSLLGAASRLARSIERGALTQPPGLLYRSYVHLHCNRLFGVQSDAEARVLGLLLRTYEGLHGGRRRAYANG